MADEGNVEGRDPRGEISREMLPSRPEARAWSLRRPPGRPRRVGGNQSTQAPHGRAPRSTIDKSVTSETAVPVLCPVTPRLFDLVTAAGYLGVSPWTVRDLEAAGILPRVRVPLPHGG